jgi:hypothetical protein
MRIFNRNRKIKENLLESFGKIKDESFDFTMIESYFRKKDNSDAFQVLSDRTCNDLDFEELFMFLDRTNSKVGQQYLYNKLRCIPHKSEYLKDSEPFIKEFSNNTELRIKIQNYLNKLSEPEAYYISTLFQDNLIRPPKWYFMVRILSVSSIITFILAFFNPKFFLILLGIFMVNMVIHYWNKKNLYNYFSSIPQLLRLAKVAHELIKIQALTKLIPEVEKSVGVIDKVKRHMVFFNLEAKLQSDIQAIPWFIFEIFKTLFLLEPLLLFGALKQLNTKRKEIEDVFMFVGETDVLISIASLRNGSESYCIPDITEKPGIVHAKEVYHPLIFDCVKNSINIDGKSVLLTGSNMSGKTSFIRTIGINVITGLCLNTFFADSFSIPRMRVFSAIRISDDLMNDRSYYFEEVMTIKELISHSNSEHLNLFLLDEIFKGTNTIERISAGKAVLSNLVKSGNIVLVSTHDIELTELLNQEYELYHFSENVNEKTVDFDYKLKNGKLQNRNAIRILQINDYPEHIIKEAIEISQELSRIRN